MGDRKSKYFFTNENVINFNPDSFTIKKVGNDSTDVIKNNEIRSDTLPTTNSIPDIPEMSIYNYTKKGRITVQDSERY